MIKKSFKTYGVFFNAIYNGNATALEMPTGIELKVGNYVLFQEYSHNGGLTGRELLARVTFVYRNQMTQNGLYSFFSFKLVKSVEDAELHRFKRGDMIDEATINKIVDRCSELIHQAEVDKNFRLFIKKQLQEIAYGAGFTIKAQIEKLLVAFDRKHELESSRKEVVNG